MTGFFCQQAATLCIIKTFLICDVSVYRYKKVTSTVMHITVLVTFLRALEIKTRGS